MALTAVLALLAPAPASAERSRSVPDAASCTVSSIFLYGYSSTFLCLNGPTPVISPAFYMVEADNPSAQGWCLFTGTNYSGFVRYVPPGDWVRMTMTVASATPCTPSSAAE